MTECLCGHMTDEHRRLGTRVIGAPVYAECRVAGCGCSEFRARPGDEPATPAPVDPAEDSPAVKAWMESGPEPWSQR